jgi:hypothetical protein
VGCGVQTEMMSRPSPRSPWTVSRAAGISQASAASLARWRSMSQTPTMTVSSRARKASRWFREIAPQPAIPMRRGRAVTGDGVVINGCHLSGAGRKVWCGPAEAGAGLVGGPAARQVEDGAGGVGGRR